MGDLTGDATPLIDEAGLRRLEDALGASAVRDLMNECLMDVRAACAELERRRAAGEAAGAKRAAHKLAGVLGQFACPAGAAAARALADADELDAILRCRETLDVVAATVSQLAERFRLS